MPTYCSTDAEEAKMAHSPYVNSLTDQVKTMTELQAKATLMSMIRMFGGLENEALKRDLLAMSAVTMAQVAYLTTKES